MHVDIRIRDQGPAPDLNRRDAPPMPMQLPPHFGSPLLDTTGKIYVSLAVVWTALVAGGTLIFLRHRNLPFIQLKNVPLVIAALALLHLQLVFDLLQYPLNGWLPCTIEFWIMNICLPLGIAAFQTNNWVLLSRAWGQKHLLSKNSGSKGVLAERSAADLALHGSFLQRKLYAWRQLCILKKMYRVVAVATAIQFIVALVIFLVSRRFHGSFGLVGDQATSFECRAGWEWFPSGIWQAVWTYGVGPFILFKIRKIRDTHHWRLQTTLAILFSLPALPLWLSTWFTLDFYIMNTYWAPTMWFVPGLAAMEFIILFFPLMEIYTFTHLQKKAREEPGHNKFSKYSAAALECALRNEADLDRLEEFAATKDLTGENIMFLKSVAAWKAKFHASENNGTPEGMQWAVRRELYDEAEQIWGRLIDQETAHFPLNIDDSIYRSLERVFGSTNPCSSASSRSNIAPFADDVWLAKRSSQSDCIELCAKEASVSVSENDWMGLPGGLGLCKELFDRAESSVRQMVLENTWIRYVDSLPEEERQRIGVADSIGGPVSWRWRSGFWKRNSSGRRLNGWSSRV